jgi:hypothetical protein
LFIGCGGEDSTQSGLFCDGFALLAIAVYLKPFCKPLEAIGQGEDLISATDVILELVS